MNTFFPQSKYYLDVILSALIFGLSHLVLTNRAFISLILCAIVVLSFAIVLSSFSFMQNLSGFLFTIISIIIFLDSGGKEKSV